MELVRFLPADSADSYYHRIQLCHDDDETRHSDSHSGNSSSCPDSFPMDQVTEIQSERIECQLRLAWLCDASAKEVNLEALIDWVEDVTPRRSSFPESVEAISFGGHPHIDTSPMTGDALTLRCNAGWDTSISISVSKVEEPRNHRFSPDGGQYQIHPRITLAYHRPPPR